MEILQAFDLTNNTSPHIVLKLNSDIIFLIQTDVQLSIKWYGKIYDKHSSELFMDFTEDANNVGSFQRSSIISTSLDQMTMDINMEDKFFVGILLILL